MLTRGANLRTLSVLAATVTPDQTTLGEAYELSADLKLTKQKDSEVAAYVQKNTPIPQGIITADEASVIFEESGVRWRLPRSASPAQDALLARGEFARALLLDLRCIFPFEKPLWEPRALLTLMERTLPSVFTVLHDGVQADTGTGRSELVYHSGLPRGSSLHSRLEVLR